MVLFRFPAFFMHYLTESFRPFCIFVPMLEKNEIIQSALQNLKIESLNPMQEAALEQGTGRKDVILLSPTGSGKTLAYLLPLLLTLKPNDDSVQVLILVPSRELALQIDTVFRSMGTSWKTCCCYGGHPIAEEKKSIAGNHPAIIIGTPGRITDHLSKRNFDPETIETLIIDEFDKSLEFGFHDEMAEIITQLPGLKKRMLLSATDAEEIPQFTGLNRTVKLDFLPEATEEQENRLKLMKVLSPSKDKIATLYNLLCTLGSSSSIVFCNHRDAVDRVHKLLEDKKLSAERFHGGMEQPDRERALYKFRNGSCHATEKGAEDCPRRIAHLCHPNRFTEQAQSGFGRRKPGSKTEIYAGNPPNQQSVSGEKEPERKGDVSIATGCNRHHCTSQKQAGKNSQEGERCKEDSCFLHYRQKHHCQNRRTHLIYTHSQTG